MDLCLLRFWVTLTVWNAIQPWEVKLFSLRLTLQNIRFSSSSFTLAVSNDQCFLWTYDLKGHCDHLSDFSGGQSAILEGHSKSLLLQLKHAVDGSEPVIIRVCVCMCVSACMCDRDCEREIEREGEKFRTDEK